MMRHMVQHACFWCSAAKQEQIEILEDQLREMGSMSSPKFSQCKRTAVLFCYHLDDR